MIKVKAEHGMLVLVFLRGPKTVENQILASLNAFLPVQTMSFFLSFLWCLFSVVLGVYFGTYTKY